jgi:diguanylate cyclase (GGDEF)-like protein
LRILLIGPNSKAHDGIAGLLRARGHQVLALQDGLEALSQLETDRCIDAVITDTEAGAISGVELCWETRVMIGPHRPIYVLMLASDDDENARIEALDSGADDVIDWPARPAELCAKLRGAERMLTLQRKLVQSATIDPLSGALNRGAFFNAATEVCSQTDAGLSLSVLLIDIDHLKATNDRYGHEVGDRAIRAVSALAQRGDVIVGRLGGDELVILLKDRSLTDALDFASNLQSRLAALKLDTVSGTVRVTCSFGASEFRCGDTIDELLKRADVALYRAKTEGRNRVVAATSQDCPTERPEQVDRFRLLPRPSAEVKERRHRSPPGDGLLARVCAVIDLLVAVGLSEEAAANTMAQKMLSAGIAFPRNSQVTGWADYILVWRRAFRHGIASNDALEEYRNVVAAINSIPPEDRLECVLESDLWNRRRITLRRQPQVELKLH